MPISGASATNAAFLSDALNSQRLRLDTTTDSLWQDDQMAFAGSDDVAICTHEKLVLLFDGRLIGRRELSARLGTAGNSPPRDILDAYRRWGDEFTRYLQGDFALALWDAGNRRLLLARDTGGCRPLHYWFRGDQFRLASEARGLLSHGDIPLVSNERRIAQCLSGIPETSGDTYFQGVSVVPCGHTVVWERGRVTVRDFWQPSSIPELRLSDSHEYAEGLRTVLDTAIRERIEEFSTVGCHLSGGLDSSSVTATAAAILQERGGRARVFTAVPAIALDDANFPGRFCDESSHAAATAALFRNIEHVLISNVSRGLFHTLDRMSSAWESPQLNPANSCWIHAICTDAADHGIRVMLTGIKGNFSISWDGRRALSTLIANGRIPAAIGLALAQRKQGINWSATVKSGIRPLLPSRILRMLNSSRDSTEIPGSRREFLINARLPVEGGLRGFECPDGRSLRIRAFRRADPGSPNAALRRLTGVEEIHPACDRRVMEFCLSVPEEFYCAHGRGRSLIKDAMAGILPPNVLEERRRGRQSADVLFHLTREKAEIKAELNRLKKVDLAVRCLDLPKLERMVQAWPSPPYGRPEHMKFGNQLMRAISMGRFIRTLEEGTLFRDQLPVGTRSA